MVVHPDEASKKDEKYKMTARLWDARMENGVLHFPKPEDCNIRRILRNSNQKEFVKGRNFAGLDEFSGGETDDLENIG